jgi:hypothetical protein
MNERQIIIEGIKQLDSILDTIVFGRPLGLFGELINHKKEETKEDVVITKTACEGQPRDKNGRFCKVEVKVTKTAPKKEDNKYSLIGKRMKVENDDYTKTLSGRYGYVEGQPLTILSEPFDDADCEDVEFVKVMSEETGREYFVEFRESWLIK